MVLSPPDTEAGTAVVGPSTVMGAVTSVEDESVWSSLRALLGDRRSLVLALVVSSVMAGLAEAGILAISAEIATSLVGGTREVSSSLGPFRIHTTPTDLSLIAGILAILRLLLQIPISWCPAAITANVEATMRGEGFRAFISASWGLQSEDRNGHFQELMTNQVAQASIGVIYSTTLMVAASTFVVLAVSAFALNVLAAAVILVVAVGLFFAMRPLNRSGQAAARRLSQAQIEFAGAVGEVNSTAEEVRVFGTAGSVASRIDALIMVAKREYLRTQILSRAVPGIYQSLIYLLLVAGLFGLSEGHVGGFTELGAVVLLLVRAGTYGQQIQQSYVQLRQALPFIERVDKAERRYAAARDLGGAIALGHVRSLSFEDVTYSYSSDRPVLQGVSYTVRAGETVGVIGPSGAGKSTMVQILLRLRTPDGGRFLLNGRPAADFTSSDWSSRVAYVPQQPRLIHGSVAENVRFGRSITDAAVEHACRLARIHDEISTWPAGYETVVGPREAAISGGQQQRICLARALVADPELLVLDEPTSALDPHSESLIQESLVSLQSSMTLFIIAHRMSTLTICDRVLVLRDGRLDAFDTLESLRDSNAYYRAATGIPPVAEEDSDLTARSISNGNGTVPSESRTFRTRPSRITYRVTG